MGDIKLLQGDCLELIKEIPDASVDLVLTDPPYCVGATSNGSKATFSDNALIKPFFDALFGEFARVLKPSGAAYVFSDWRTYPFLFAEMQKHMLPRNLVVWSKGFGPGLFYRFTHELIMFAPKAEFRRRMPMWRETDVWRDIAPVPPAKKLHPAQKPAALVEKILMGSTDEGGVVLDCFMGSGTTGVACVNTGRKFIGMELDERYFEIAQRRIADAQKARAETLGFGETA